MQRIINLFLLQRVRNKKINWNQLKGRNVVYSLKIYRAGFEDQFGNPPFGFVWIIITFIKTIIKFQHCLYLWCLLVLLLSLNAMLFSLIPSRNFEI